MDFVRLIFESEGTLVFNNELTVSDFPVAFDLPRGTEVLADSMGERQVVRAGIDGVEINPNLFVVGISSKTKGSRNVRVISQVTHGPLPFMFLQHVRKKEYALAKKLLGFDISEKGLKDYFGDFELLLNNYLEDENLVSIIKGGQVQTLRFVVEAGTIVNLS